MIIEKGVEMDNTKVKAFMEWPTHSNSKELQRLLGFTNFYRHFIHGYSSVATPLTTLLCGKPRRLHWSQNAKEAFELFNESFNTAPILWHPDPEWPFVLEVDASSFSIWSHGRDSMSPGEWAPKPRMPTPSSLRANKACLLSMIVPIYPPAPPVCSPEISQLFGFSSITSPALMLSLKLQTFHLLVMALIFYDCNHDQDKGKWRWIDGMNSMDPTCLVSTFQAGGGGVIV